MKPHGHGDVHLLMQQNGVARQWLERGVKWLCFFQDTNALVFRALVSALGVSESRQLALNFVSVPRTPGEAVGIQP